MSHDNCFICMARRPEVGGYTIEFDPALLKGLWTAEIAPPKKESTVSVVTITKHTAEANARRIRRAERELKNANAGTSKTRVEVSAHTYADEPYASLYVQVPGESDREDGQYASVVMNVADLEALETAVFIARKAVVKATESKVVRVAEMKL